MANVSGFASRVAAAASRVASAVRRPRWPTSTSSAPPPGQEPVMDARARLQQESGHGRLIKASAKKLGRIIYLANIPLRLQLPPRCENLIELIFRCPPRTSKIEIRKVLQLVYGMDVMKVHTLNYDSRKKIHRSGKFYVRTASYKKAYVYLNRPITLSRELFPLNVFYGEGQDQQGQQQQQEQQPAGST